MITVAVEVDGTLENVWNRFTNPAHIVNWNFAADDWQCPWAHNDLRVNGTFTTRMEAKDGSAGFEFSGKYTLVSPYEGYRYVLEDGRNVIVNFTKTNGKIRVSEEFDPEAENSLELQKTGWQSIMDNFKKYCESQS